MSAVPQGAELPRLVARTVTIPDPGDLTALLPAEPSPLAWVRNGDGVIGWGCAARFRGSGPNRFADAADWWEDLTDHGVMRDAARRPGSGLVAFGSFAFGDRQVDDSPDDSEVSVLTVPSLVVGRDRGVSWLTTIAADPGLPSIPEVASAPPPAPPVDVQITHGALDDAGWAGIVAAAVERIAAGELAKVVLARDLVATAAEPVDLRHLLTRLAAGYPGCWTYAVDGLVGATPEMLVRLRDGLITSRVLAGTIRRTGDDEHDLALAGSLARSSKDLEEHRYAVGSVAESLAPYCSGMNVPEQPFVLHLPNVMHLASDVTGAPTDSGANALRLAGVLHPSAAVCGTPRLAAARLIDDLESMDRGRYAGPVGWIGADGDGEFGLALRCAQRDPADPRRLRLFAGCGIVAGSDPAAELAEAAAKTLPIREALAASEESAAESPVESPSEAAS